MMQAFHDLCVCASALIGCVMERGIGAFSFLLSLIIYIISNNNIYNNNIIIIISNYKLPIGNLKVTYKSPNPCRGMI